ncbi:TylF/MycF/NovP-related O-methyltransferase [Candidatus Pelagibacter sp. HIMB1509]|uniref:TylF/MycF/NovP-related O-methyltransferase n=1 Tax=Candidatus Pelagibacter sp. HIMB1509 TaxID=3413339 RepID=UPI003F851BA4
MKKDLFKIENLFYRTTNSKRISKFCFQYEIFKKIKKIKGSIIDYGVLNGSSLFRFAIFSEIESCNKMIYGFDTFKKPKILDKDFSKKKFNQWYKSLSDRSTYKQLLTNIKKRKFNKIKLIKGHAEKTIPKFFEKSIKISLINLDFDLYYPTKVALEKSWPMLSKKGIIILDNYKVFDGETKAVNEFLKENKLLKKLKKVKIYRTFYYLQK